MTADNITKNTTNVQYQKTFPAPVLFQDEKNDPGQVEEMELLQKWKNPNVVEFSYKQ